MATEGDYTSKMLKLLRANFEKGIVLKVSDRFTGGVPDFNTTANKICAWWEVKKGTNGHINSMTELQLETCRDLAREGVCWYIVYEKRRGAFLTHIVHPADMRRDKFFTPAVSVPGISHEMVVNFIKRTHDQAGLF
jgi:hypothetical protein